MMTKFVLGGLYGVVVGTISGWLWFGSIGGALGLGCAMAACICGVLASVESEDDIS